MDESRKSMTDYADRQAKSIVAVAEHIDRSREENERKGWRLTAVTLEQLQRKLKRSNSRSTCHDAAVYPGRRLVVFANTQSVTCSERTVVIR